MEECYVFFVWLPNIEARLHQLPTALEDAVPGEEGRRGIKGYLPVTDKHSVKNVTPRHTDDMHAYIKTHTKTDNLRKQLNKIQNRYSDPNTTPTLWLNLALAVFK